MKNKKVLIIGDIMLDHYIYGFVNRQSPEDNRVSILDYEEEIHKLGGSANVATNLKSLNKDLGIYLYGLINDEMEEILNDFNLNWKQHCLFTPYPILKQRFINKNTKQQLLRLDNLQQYMEADLIDLRKEIGIDLVKNNFEEFDCIIISDYCKGVVDNFILYSLELYNGPIFIDTKKSNLSLWKNLKNYIIKINSKEYKNLINKDHIKNLIVTRGPEGCSYFDGENWKKFFTDPVESPDVVGAGDSFLAGLVKDYLENENIESAIKFANKVATVSVQKEGTSVVTMEEINE
jgi:rfaE bifunctional protein kinase chain/domain